MKSRIPNCAKCGESLKSLKRGGRVIHQFRIARRVVRCGWCGDCMDDIGPTIAIRGGKESTAELVAKLLAIRQRGDGRVLGVLPGDQS